MGQLFIQRLNEVIDTNIDNSNFGVEELAKGMDMSRSALYRKIHDHTGKSTTQYIRDFKMKLAIDWLQEGLFTVSEVADRLGFSSASYFSTAFHEHFGYPPLQARKMASVNSQKGNGDEEVVKNIKKIKIKNLVHWPINHKKIVFGGFVAILLIVIGPLMIKTGLNPKEDRTIAVMPFFNRDNDTIIESFKIGLRDQLLNELEDMEVLNVVSRISPNSSRFTSMQIPKIGRKLNADYLISGTIFREGELLKVDIEIIKAKNTVFLEPLPFTRQWDDSIKLRKELAKDIAHHIGAYLFPDRITNDSLKKE